jgi:succinate dehydrogenase subunit C
MGEPSQYTEYHPRWLRRQISPYWWLERGSYFAFMLREVSCVFVAWMVVFLLLLIRAVGQGEASYQEFLSWSGTPSILLLNVVSLIFILYHTVTFFGAAQTIVVVRLGGKLVPGSLILASHYAGLVAASAVVFWILLGV